MANTVQNSKEYAQLRSEGFCLIKKVLTPEMISELKSLTDKMIDECPKSELEEVRYQGSNIFMQVGDPTLARLITWPQSFEALANLGFDNPKYWSGYILSKPPGGPALYWHNDWHYGYEPMSTLPEPPLLFLMYYLVDTNRENGCLRVIPKTHLKRIPFQDQLPPAHTEATYKAPPTSPLFAHHPDEIDIPVCAGDLLIGDARLLHSAHPNVTEKRRTLLTLWYLPNTGTYTDSFKATIMESSWEIPSSLPEDLKKEMERVRPYYL